MRALSVHQPWAFAILHLGKNVENRRWQTTHRGPLLVHASKSRSSYDRQQPDLWRRRFGVALPPWEELAAGALVGVVDVVGCVRPDWVLPERVEVPGLGECPWADPGGWCWVLADPRPFPEPVPYRGAQLLFHVPDDAIPAGII